MFGRLKRVHFVGIGGVGMSGIALVLKNLGFDVTGSDVKESDATLKLAEAGIRVSIGHDAANCADAQVVVYSSAVSSENPELAAARGRDIPVIRRAEMLAELMRMKFSVAISGSHGKTTVTSMVAHLMERAGLDPTSVIGGRVMGADAGAKLGRSEYLVAEADESDRSFLALYPAIAVVTNIEREHLDVYHDLADIKREFTRFVNRVPFYGSVVLCMDSPAVRSIRRRAKRRVVTYAVEGRGTGDGGWDFRARDIQLYGFSSAFTLLYGGKEVGRFNLPVPGVHNVANALAALATGSELGIGFDAMAQAMAVFSGVHRRLEKLGEKNGIVVYDDYGHHPTEVRVTLEALRHAFPDRRIMVVFQPHRYTRTRALAEEFGTCFAAADELMLTKIYAASEPEIPGVDATLILRAVQAAGKPPVTYVPEMADMPGMLAGKLHKGDVVLIAGAGNICTIGAGILAKL
ncbi:UDP-N-acetylmuramate--L-alanine ligase [candidate division WOR-3 bacterium]|nr:UDP-N-acetylmuramate--L-alanine ligase [candidate division WOR-3 bacterium]